MAVMIRELDSCLDPGTQGLNEELGRHSYRDELNVRCVVLSARV